MALNKKLECELKAAPVVSLAEKYFSKEATFGFLPTLLDIHVLKLLATCEPEYVYCVSDLINSLKIAKKHVLGLIRHLQLSDLVSMDDTQDNPEVTLLEQGKDYYHSLLKAEEESTLACIEQVK